MSDPEAFSDCALKLAPRDPRVLAGEESAYGPLSQAKRAGTGADEALFLAETFPCQVTAYRPFSHLIHRQNCHCPCFMDQEAEVQRVNESPGCHSKEKAEQRLLGNLAGLFLLAGVGGSGPSRAPQAGKCTQSAGFWQGQKDPLGPGLCYRDLPG